MVLMTPKVGSTGPGFRNETRYEPALGSPAALERLLDDHQSDIREVASSRDAQATATQRIYLLGLSKLLDDSPPLFGFDLWPALP